MPTQALPSSIYLTPNQAAAEGYGGYSTLLQRIRSGALPAERGANGRWRIRRDDLESMLDGATSSQASIEAAVARVVAQADALTSSQLAKIAAALGARAGGAASTR